MMEIKKEKYVELLEMLEIQRENVTLSLEQDEVLIEHVKKKIASFPEDDPMPEEIKEITKAIK